MATKRWIGKAVDVRQVDTIVVAGTWTGNPTITLTIGSRDVVITIGSLTTTAQVATTIYQAWQGITFTDTTATVNIVDSVGVSDVDNVPEFSEITASVSSSTVTLRANTIGKPFTLSVAETASGTLTHTNDGSGSSVVATGKSYFDNVDNWDTGTLPTTGDDVWFDGPSPSCLYGLDQSAVTILDLNVTASFTAAIGLGEQNTDNAARPYTEYRDKYLTFQNLTGKVNIGRGSGLGSGRVRIDASAQSCAWKIYASGTRLNSNVPAVLLLSTGTDSSIYAEGSADVGFSYFSDEAGHLGTIRTEGDARVSCGAGTDLANATISCNSGTCEVNSDMTTGTVNIDGGTVITSDEITGTLQTANVYTGFLLHKSDSTITNLNVGKGTADFDGNSGAIGVTNCVVHSGSTLIDSLQRVTWSSDIILDDCGIEDVNLQLGKDITIRRI